MEKLKTVALMIILSLVLFCGCAPKENVPITSEWRATRIIFNGETTHLTFTDDDVIPKFTTDGNNFTFSFDGKSHSGILVQSGSSYELDFDDVESFFGTVEGDRLSITVPYSESNIVFVFKAK